MKKILLTSTIALTALLFSNCASIFTKTQYPVSLTSNPSEAVIKVTDSNGMTIFNGKTPATVTLASSKGYFSKAIYTVEYTKEGYETMTAPVTATIEGWYFGNILLGGLIGMLIVDPATGAMWKLDKNVSAELVPLKSAAASLRVLDINEIPDAWKEQLVAIN